MGGTCSTRRRCWIAIAAATTTIAAAVSFGAGPAPVDAGSGRLQLAQPSDVVRDAIGTPAANADVAGMWSDVLPWPMVSIHAVVAQTGELVTFGATFDQATPGQNGEQYDQWDPATGQHLRSPLLPVDSFCNIAVHDRDGRIFVVGGNSWNTSGRYDPATRSYQQASELTEPRWYSSLVRLADDRLVVLGGARPYPWEPDPPDSVLAITPEVYDPSTGDWSRLAGATSSTYFGGEKNRWWYPKSFLAPNGHVFGIAYDRMFLLDPSGPGAIVDRGTVAPSTTRGLGAAAAAVMFEPGRILIAGGGQLSNGQPAPATTDAAVIDIRDVATSPASVTATGSLHRARNWINLVTQPDGSVLAVGGVPFGNDLTTSPSLTAERWDPATGTWTELAPSGSPRSYHASAALMPSGAVFQGGTGAPGYPDSLENAEFFYPPSLFVREAGIVRWADRPEIQAIAGRLAHGGTVELELGDDREIASLSLITLGSNTHSVSMSERRVPVPFTRSGRVLTADLPDDPAMLPPGVYLLTAVDAAGVPSPSQIVEIRGDGSPGAVTVFGTGMVVPPDLGTTTTTTSTTTTTTTTSTTTTTPSTTTSTTSTTSTTTTSSTTTTPSTTTTTTTTPSITGRFRGTSPTRVMDTRPGGTTFDGVSAGGGQVGPGEVTLPLAGRGPVPPGASGAVVLNVTAVAASERSYVTVWPTGQPQPLASNVNVEGADPTPNLVVVPLGVDGRVSLFNRAGRMDLVVDLLGWLPAGSGFTGLTPARVLDTRALPTVDGRSSGNGPIGPGRSLNVPIAGRGGVPDGADAVAVNLTATGPTQDTYLVLAPSGRERPTASNLNPSRGTTRANMAIVPLGDDGSIEVFNFAGSTEVVVDVLGWFDAGDGFRALPPARLMDTRAQQPTVDARAAGGGAVSLGSPRTLQVLGRGGVPSTGVGSVALNVTVTEPTVDGFATVHPTGVTRPLASNLNFTAGRTVANMVVVPVGADGSVVLDVSVPSAHLVVDVLGWFPSS